MEDYREYPRFGKHWGESGEYDIPIKHMRIQANPRQHQESTRTPGEPMRVPDVAEPLESKKCHILSFQPSPYESTMFNWLGVGEAVSWIGGQYLVTIAP